MASVSSYTSCEISDSRKSLAPTLKLLYVYMPVFNQPSFCYCIITVELIRSAGDEDGQYDKLLENKTNKEDLVAIFDSLNFLGGCAWRTNKRILDIAVHMFNNGGNEDLAIPGPVVQPEVDSISLK